MTQTPPIMDSDDQLDAMKRSLTELGISLDRIIAQRDRYKEALEQIRRKSQEKYSADRANDALNAP